jgi:hypothetical protein
MAYTSADSGKTNSDEASKANYSANKVIGDAIKETSTAGVGSTSWYGDYSYFAGYANPFFERGDYWYDGSIAGLFCFSRTDGASYYHLGFRSVLVAK